MPRVRGAAGLQRHARRRRGRQPHAAGRPRRGTARRPVPDWAVVLDLPVSQAVEQRISDETGIRIGEVAAEGSTRTNLVPSIGRAVETVPADPLGTDQTFSLTTQRWVAFLDYVDWVTGTRRAPRWRCASTPGPSTIGCPLPRPASAR
ncbi:MAG: hypothetical protein R2712_11190 [Vicinamibacterales bacterium]